MAELDPRPGTDASHHRATTAAEREDHEIIERQGSQLIKLSKAIRLADFMAILMVIATIFSAYAAWRTAEVTRLVYATADRPFLGVHSAVFEAKDSPRPTIAIDFRNFGQIPAIDGIVTVYTLVDGKVIKPIDGMMSSQGTGLMPPAVPHYFYAYLTPELYRTIVSGQSSLQIHVDFLYKGPVRTLDFCYRERLVFDFRSATFRTTGGSDRCGSEVF